MLRPTLIFLSQLGFLSHKMDQQCALLHYERLFGLPLMVRQWLVSKEKEKEMETKTISLMKMPAAQALFEANARLLSAQVRERFGQRQQGYFPRI